MKLKHRALALILSAVMVLTFMPALAFADDEAVDNQQPVAEKVQDEAALVRKAPAASKAHAPSAGKAPEAANASAARVTSVSYEADEAVTAYIGSTYADIEVEGATIVVGYSNGKSVTYKYMPYVEDEETGEEIHESGWYIDGNYNNGRFELECYVNTRGLIKEGDNECYLKVWDNSIDDYAGDCKINVVGVKDEDIVSVSYEHVSGKALTGIAETWEKKFTYLTNTGDDDYYDGAYEELEGDKFTVERRVEREVWNDETEDYEVIPDIEKTVYTCQKITDEEGYTYYSFVNAYTDEEDGETYYDYEYPDFYDDQIEGEWTWASLEKGEVTVALRGVEADTKLYVDIPQVKLMKSAELVLADGFEPKVSVGQDDWIETDAFFGEGNKLVITYTDDTVKTYTYDPGRYSFVDEDGYEAWFSADLEEQGIKLEKGVPTEVTFRHWYENEAEDFYDSVDFKLTVTAKKTAVYAAWGGEFQYTGKVVRPKKMIVRTVYGDKAIPTSAYKYTLPKSKAIKRYDVYIKLLNTDDYFAMYNGEEDELWGEYEIIPKRIKISKLVRGKKSFTVKWKKLSKKDQKLVTGIYVEYATKKNFSDSKIVKVKKNAASKTIKKLKGNKYYYVRLYTYKTCKFTYYDENGKKRTGKYELWSKPSPVKKVKTKK